MKSLIKNSLLVVLALSALVACRKIENEIAPGYQAKSSQEERVVEILATTDLKDVEEMIGKEVLGATGLTIKWVWGGTMDNTEKVMTGQTNADMAWFANAKYVLSDPVAKTKVKQQEKIMLTPLVVGVFESDVKKMGWSGKTQQLTWSDFAKKAKTGEFRYAMSNPASSNQGFTALIGVASATAKTGEVLRVEDVNQKVMSDFLSGYVLRGDNSTYLAEQFVKNQSIDGGPNAFINYESWILNLNKSGKLKEKLILFYPKEGVATADYPLLLLNEKKQADYTAITTFLRSNVMQKKLAEISLRRPVVQSVFEEVKDNFEKTPELLIEMPFTATREVSDAILFSYLNEHRKPASSFFVLDVSGSMEGKRIRSLIKAVKDIAGDDKSLTGSLSSLNNREIATMIPFSGRVGEKHEFVIPSLPTSKDEKLAEIRRFADTLSSGGGTAIFDATLVALTAASEKKSSAPNFAYSIVLFTDGENSSGRDLDDFNKAYQKLNSVAKTIPIFAILYGEGKSEEMKILADLSGGKVFDAKKTPLSTVFKEIRANQ